MASRIDESAIAADVAKIVASAGARLDDPAREALHDLVAYERAYQAGAAGESLGVVRLQLRLNETPAINDASAAFFAGDPEIRHEFQTADVYAAFIRDLLRPRRRP